MKNSRLLNCLVAFALSLCGQTSLASEPVQPVFKPLVPEPIFGNAQASSLDYVRVRCNPDAKTTYIQSLGSMYAHVEGAQPRYLFDFVGVDVSKCIFDLKTNQWWLLSRKFSLYLDPETKHILRTWKNPWTYETLNVMHRAYDYQEFAIPEHMSMFVAGSTGIISLDFNSLFPNPLSADPRFADYSPQPYIEATDSYKFLFPISFLNANADPRALDAGAVSLSYFRVSTWEPWMKMGQKPGKLVLNYSGVRVRQFEDLPAVLRNQLDKRLPLLKEAPACRLQRSIARSTTRFAEEFDAYLRGDEFPFPEPLHAETCL